MSLFVINRYGGEEPKDETPKEDHLSALLQKIEARKREREKLKKPEAAPPKKKLKKTAPEKNSSQLTEEPQENETPPEEKSETPTEKSRKLDPGFMILSSKKNAKKQHVKRILPDWLANPNIIPSDLSSGTELTEGKLELNERFLEILKSQGFERFFPVQDLVVDFILKCDQDRKSGFWVRDVCVCAPTGSGKTLAYVLPIMQILQNISEKVGVRRVRCLVVLPVQELAAQVYKVFSSFCVGTDLKVGLISGASSLEEEQKKIVNKGKNGIYESLVDILVATPGHFVDHVEKTEGFSCHYLRFLVIDEADRATDWLHHVPPPHCRPPPLTLANLRSYPIPPAQKILLSATLSQDPEKLSRLGLFNPILFTTMALKEEDEDLDLDKLQRYVTPENLREKAIECIPEHKPLAVYHLLAKKSAASKKVLVFANSGMWAHRLAILLKIMLKKKNVVVRELSSQLTPKKREKVLENFAKGEINVLVSTDALARGIDIPCITMVVSYNIPKYIEGYVHRIGRTGRAGLPGLAVSIITPRQNENFIKMLRTVHKELPKMRKKDFSELAETIDYCSHLENLQNILAKENSKQKQRKKPNKVKGGED